MNVLVVDDKRVIGDFFDFTLGYYGHTIKVVHDSDEAIKEASQGNFDVAFLDIIMPKKDGLEVLAEIKKMTPGLPVVMMSGYSVEEKRVRAQALGAVTCLKKPFDVADIRGAIKEALGKDITSS